MSLKASASVADAAISNLDRVFLLQHAASRRDPYPSAALRCDRLSRLIDLLCRHQSELCDAVSTDFGRRSAANTRLFDILPPLNALKYARSHVAEWMRPRRRRSNFPYNVIGAKSTLLPVPLGVVGNIAPWNFPLTLALSPIGGMLAAGNRVIIKPSDMTPATSEALRTLLAKHFAEDEICAVTGGSELAAHFSTLQFDHILFTGSTQIGRRVALSAAANLVPVTLELGGKSPVLVGRSATVRDVAAKVTFAKTTNAGQICLAPDYLIIDRARRDDLVEEMSQVAKRLYPHGLASEDYVNILSERHAQRLRNHLADAEARGSRVIPLFDVLASTDTRALAPHVVLVDGDGGSLMEEEIFGPVLPILAVDSIDEAMQYVNERPHPLAIYYFGTDRDEIQRITRQAPCGGLVINDVMMHFLQDDLPFGGVGDSGTGSYHAREGFERFSHAKPVFTQSRIDIGGLLHPPYGKRMSQLLKMQIKR